MNKFLWEKLALVYTLNAMNNLTAKPGVMEVIRDTVGCSLSFAKQNLEVEKDIRKHVSLLELTYAESCTAMRMGFKVTHNTFKIGEFHHIDNGVVYSNTNEVVLGFETLKDGWRIVC